MLPIVSYRQRQRRSNQRVLGPERDVGRGRRRPRLARAATQTCADNGYSVSSVMANSLS